MTETTAMATATQTPTHEDPKTESVGYFTSVPNATPINANLLEVPATGSITWSYE